MSDAGKFISGTMQAMSAMIHLELPHVSAITKMDLLPPNALEECDLIYFTGSLTLRVVRSIPSSLILTCPRL